MSADHVWYVAPYVEFIDSMGSDARVVNAARVSFSKEVDENKPCGAADEKLIGYLADHEHISPFFHIMITLRIKMPIFCAREWYRHTVGFSRNEVSRRYVDSAVDCFEPLVYRARSAYKKQGSTDQPVINYKDCARTYQNACASSIEAYRNLLANDCAPEIARMVLPQSMMTEFIETGSLAAYARLCGLRNSPDAQHEIRAYACVIDELMKVKFPVSWKALTSK